MTVHISMQFLWGLFLIFAMIAITSYMRILVILSALDAGLENPPHRRHMQDKLRAYRDWCRDRRKVPILLILFAIGAFGAVICWIPLPWIIYH
jgi:hypothetical protein